MNKRTVQSIVAIPSGWLAAVGGYIVVMVAIAIFYREPFRPGAQLSAEWWLITLFIGFVCDVMGGFVTAVIARRKEIEHALGLVFFSVFISVYLWSRNSGAVQVPSWYMAAGYALTPAYLLGAWLCKKQRILLDQKSTAMIKAIEKTRLVVAALVACAVFFFVLIWGTAFAAAGLHWLLRRFLGEEHLILVLPVSILFLVLASVVARRLFKWIIGVREDLGESDEDRGAPEEEK